MPVLVRPSAGRTFAVPRHLLTFFGHYSALDGQFSVLHEEEVVVSVKLESA